MICLNWEGFPQYGARCVRAFVRLLNGEKVVVIARRPDVPIKGMEELCGCPVIWIEQGEKRSICDICGEMPRFMSFSGWFLPLYNQWRDEVRAAGGRVCCGTDNNYMLDTLHLDRPSLKILMRTIVGKILFGIRCRNKYNYFFVPGKSGRRLMRFYGASDHQIVEGSYSADASLFNNGLPLVERKKEIIFVGRFVEIKNIERLIKAFIAANEKRDWQLALYGCGPLEKKLRTIDVHLEEKGVRLNAFLQPEELAGKYKEARFFCLPSLHDHWGLVVHEAALSGCALLLSERVGSAVDLLGEAILENTSGNFNRFVNGFTFNPHDIDALTATIRRAMSFSTQEYEAAQKVSRDLASRHSLEKFALALKKMIDGTI